MEANAKANLLSFNVFYDHVLIYIYIMHMLLDLLFQIASVESAVRSGKKLPDSEIVGLSDLLMCQLVKLEESKVEGDVKVRKKILVRVVSIFIYVYMNSFNKIFVSYPRDY